MPSRDSSCLDTAIEVQGLVLDRIKAELEDDGVANALTPTATTQYLNAATMAGGVSFNKERLKRGESTSNISVVSKMINNVVGGLYKLKPGPKMAMK